METIQPSIPIIKKKSEVPHYPTNRVRVVLHPQYYIKLSAAL